MTLTGINHLAFITPDLEGTVRFYRDLLGMELHAGIGHDGYRHYFFRCGNTQVAFFAYDGAAVMERKFHGSPTDRPLGFDHVSFTTGSREELFAVKDRLEAAGVKVTGAVDHGTIWSIYFFDPNNIPLEVSWEILEVTRPPAISDDEPLAIAAEGADPQPGHWPEVTAPTPPAEMTAHAGNGYDMRDAALREGRGRLKPDYARLVKAAE
ncbi:MAG: VOC family protein [Hyphomicrobiales bacterium]|nr:VOC family protein [Hyphomicrobiales bacterium]